MWKPDEEAPRGHYETTQHPRFKDKTYEKHVPDHIIGLKDGLRFETYWIGEEDPVGSRNGGRWHKMNPGQKLDAWTHLPPAPPPVLLEKLKQQTTGEDNA